MKQKYLIKLLPIFLFLTVLYSEALAQTTPISGMVRDAESDQPLVGVNVIIKNRQVGATTDVKGNFQFNTTETLPVTLVFSMVGYESQERNIQDAAAATGINVSLTERYMLGQEVVVSASRVEENIMQSPVSIEKVDLLAIRETTAPSFYEALANVKGVHVNYSSLNFPSFNTRGFATIANERFVQLVDGMDVSAPLLNFPTGNLVGMSELDAESMELVPGAASALYGPNAFNGILFMNSKSPFDYQGLSAQAKLGVTRSDNAGTNPLYDFSLRYATAFNNKIAFKVNFSYFDAEDWRGTNYNTDRVQPRTRNTSAPNFDGVNLYGDEAVIPIPLGGLGNLNLRRTGLREEDLMDDFSARSLKADAALHYRINPRLEGILSYRYGGGNSLYQGGEKYALRNFNQQFIKAEIRSDNFFVRAYQTITDAGNSYNLSALGAFANERFSPTRTQWAPTYAQSYVLAMQGYIPGMEAGNETAAHAFARSQADAGIPQRGTAAFEEVVDAVRNDLFQVQNGARLVDQSRLYHGEFNYNFKNQIDFLDIQIGGNLRRYDLFSNGTVFNENPTGEGENERVVIDEYGVYTQIAKRLLDDRLKLTGSIRYDKNENFEGQITPRFSAVYTVGQNHNFRASYQTGFRNPQTQAQFIYFPASEGILLGSVESNAARYGIHNGGALNSRGEVVNLSYVQPEQLVAYEIGYKGIIDNKILIDLNYYFNRYEGMMSQQTVFSREATMHQGNVIQAGRAFRPYVNADESIRSQGIGLGVTYNLFQGYTLSGNYSYASFSSDQAADSEFEPAFNTPEHRYTVAFGNRKVYKNLGFNVSFRWQDEYLWQSSFGQAQIGAFGVLDAQVNYKIVPLKTMVKIGASNLGGNDYITNLGGGQVGSIYYISLLFDQFLN
ncbi:MAG: TonB-dependent receptor [Bacteroidota bacterium]|nr:TonB-dependent receptor [Bacteroidota bacterium]